MLNKHPSLINPNDTLAWVLKKLDQKLTNAYHYKISLSESANFLTIFLKLKLSPEVPVTMAIIKSTYCTSVVLFGI